jgi:MraZ protein
VVSDVFRGEVNQKVDSKARVLIPVAFRRILEAGDPNWTSGARPKFVIVYGDARRSFAECYTIAEMKVLEASILSRPVGESVRKILARNIITLSLIAEIDEDGRIVLPQKVREKIAMSADDLRDGAEVTFAGAGSTFHLWKRDTYDTIILQKDADDLANLPEDVDLLSLLGDPSPGG